MKSQSKTQKPTSFNLMNDQQIFGYFRKHGRMPDEQTDTIPAPKKYGLYQGNALVIAGEYALLKYQKKQLESSGQRFLKIKPIINKAKV